ncbi:MAG: sugar ABC transporter permease [Anaerolineales bacterium]|nr:sugar ABC transporter permease [Anaerolineales bacterium]
MNIQKNRRIAYRLVLRRTQSHMQHRQPLSSYNKSVAIFLLPFLAGSVVLFILPALATIAISFTRFNAVQPPMWAGLDNFRAIFDSFLVKRSIRNSLVFLAMAVPIRLVAALALAMLLQSRRRFFGLFRAAVLLPTVIPEAAYALVWLWILNPIYGPLNLILSALGLPAPAWLAEPFSARMALVILAAFQIGEGFVVLIAGLRSIPRSFNDSARVDGATNWQIFKHITLPLLAPWLMLLTFRDLLVSLQNTFAPSYILTYGGPYYATTLEPLLVYELAFDFFDLGLAAAVLVLFFLLFVVLTLGVLNLLGLRGRE